MAKYKIFLLDADDTLFDFPACSKNALKETLEELGMEFTERRYKTYLTINDALWLQLECKEITHKRLFELRFSSYLRTLGEDETLADEMQNRYVVNLSKQCVTIEGAEDFLKALNALGRVIVITNGTAVVQRERFKNFNLSRYAENIFVSEEIGVYKPAKAYYDYVAAHTPNYEEDEAIIIGDSLTSDIALAGNSNMPCVWFNPKNKPLSGATTPNFTAKTYDEIVDWLKNA